MLKGGGKPQKLASDSEISYEVPPIEMEKSCQSNPESVLHFPKRVGDAR
jgi:hypothetical protein